MSSGREHISIMLKEIAPDVKPIPNHTRHKLARWDAYISTSEPDTLFEEYRQVVFHSSSLPGMTMIIYEGIEVEDARWKYFIFRAAQYIAILRI